MFHLLAEIEHTDKIVLIAHSQGGLYAQQFCRAHPALVKGLLLLDPLSPKDNEFKQALSEKEYKHSGVDKSKMFEMMMLFAKLKLGGITKRLLKNAPPFCYYQRYSESEKQDILNCADNAQHAATVLEEYHKAHESETCKALQDKESFPNIPLLSSSLAKIPCYLRHSFLLSHMERATAVAMSAADAV